MDYKEMNFEEQNAEEIKIEHRTLDPQRKRIAIILIVALLCGAIFGSSFAVTNHFVRIGLGDGNSGFTLNTVTTGSGGTLDNSGISSVVNSCMPSVVAITNIGVTEINTFFGSFQQESKSSGSGVIIGENDDELLIVTNYHVIASSKELTVVFSFDEDEKEISSDKAVTAVVKGYDSSKDIAIIAVDMNKLSKDTLSNIRVATLGKSEELVLGQQVIAIGNALGYGQSVTTGIVSALPKEMTISSDGFTFVGNYLQTDAAINPGNSGGALLNMKGELIGINAAKVASSQVDSIGYAIPIDDVATIIDKIMKNSNREIVKESERGYLGISGQTVTEEAKSKYGLPDGVYVAGVTAGSGAAKAGISEGQIITAIDGFSISSMDALQNRLQYYKSGETITITVATATMNGYSNQDLTLTLSTAKAAGIQKN